MKRKNWLFRHFDVDFWDEFIFNIIVPWVVVFGTIGGIVAIAVFATREKNYVMKCDGFVKSIDAHGETHEYILYNKGITHLPNCKFCKGVINHD